MGKNEQKRGAALRALMDSRTLTEAAEKAGISRKTLYTYIRSDSDFAIAYQEAIEESITAAAESIESRAARATEVVESIMNDQEQPGALRLKAAQMILEDCDRKRERARSIVDICAEKTAIAFPW